MPALAHPQRPARTGAKPLPWLRRKCACGNAPGLSGSCSSCEDRKMLGLQTKRMLGAPDDAFEREADAVAAHILDRPAAPRTGHGFGQVGVHAGDAAPLVRLRAVARPATGLAPPAVDSALADPGRPLEPALRGDLEQRFGVDFSQVRVHADGLADRSARAVDAHAYAAGRHIVFAAGQWAPGTRAGRQLLAHELTHVVQQGQPALAAATGPALMRSRVLDSTMRICHRELKGETVFPISQGGLVITANGNWESQEDEEQAPADAPRLECGETPYRITLTKKNTFIDDEYGTCEFDVGRANRRQWTQLPAGDYFVRISTDGANPHCCLTGSVMASDEAGLEGDSCTRPPPGPMEMLHDALMAAGMFPALGVVPDAIDTALYMLQGNWESAGVSAMAMVPIFGDAATLARIGARTVVKIEGKAVLKLGKNEIAAGLKAIKVGSKVLRRPTFRALRAGAAIDEHLLELALQHRAQLMGAGQSFGSHNIAVVKVLIDGKPAYLSARNMVGELHSEARLIQQIDGMVANRKTVEVLQLYSERIPCSVAGCMKAVNARFPKADVFFSVSEELAESAGSKAEALKVVYGLKP